jgi:hypothetical protein
MKYQRGMENIGATLYELINENGALYTSSVPMKLVLFLNQVR